MKTLLINLVRFEDGSIKVDGTLDAAHSQLLNHIAARETETATIAAAVDELFTDKLGARLNMPYVVSQCQQKLNAQPENFKALGERVAQYVRDNAGPRESGKLFNIGKGKGGGVTRHSDQPEPAAKPEAAK